MSIFTSGGKIIKDGSGGAVAVVAVAEERVMIMRGDEGVCVVVCVVAVDGGGGGGRQRRRWWRVSEKKIFGIIEAINASHNYHLNRYQTDRYVGRGIPFVCEEREREKCTVDIWN